MCMRPLSCTKKTNNSGMQKEEHDLLMAAVEAAREYPQSLTEINHPRWAWWISQGKSVGR